MDLKGKRESLLKVLEELVSRRDKIAGGLNELNVMIERHNGAIGLLNDAIAEEEPPAETPAE
jgi:hypothetical protein